MRALALAMLAPFALAACGERTDEAARPETPVAPAAAMDTATTSPESTPGAVKAGSTAVGEVLPELSGRYYEARDVLLRAGFTPRNVNSRPLAACLEEQRTGEPVDGVCANEVIFPELEDCSGTGLGFCLTRWVSPGGRGLTITTAGEPQPGAVHRVEWEQP